MFMDNLKNKIQNSAKWKEIISSIENGEGYFSEKSLKLSKLKEMFINCFMNTIETTFEFMEDNTAFIITGDIPAMWLRDSTAQVRHYIPFLREVPDLKEAVKGLIKRQIYYINLDPYANAFNKEPNAHGHSDDITEASPWVWERKYEVDSLCYPIQLAYLYWKETGESDIFDDSFKKAVCSIIDLWTLEQRHQELSSYRFERINCPESDTLKNNGMSTPVNYTGMTWSGFRPSDDACVFGYLIPANMFAVVVLGYMEEIFGCVYTETEVAAKVAELKEKINKGIQDYGIIEHPKYGKMYAYETDGFGNHLLMDDANVPSLLSIPYLNYETPDTSIYMNTRNFLLSKSNPYYFDGEFARGVGSPHTSNGYVWHIALIMQGLTASDKKEVSDILVMLTTTDSDSTYMHESFNPNNPSEFSRAWFAWANSLFAEFIYHLNEKNEIFKAHLMN